MNKPRLNRITLLKDEVEDWNAYPFCVPSIRSFIELNLHSRVCFLVGENGSGKSTFLEAIAEHSGFGREGGSRNISYSTTDSSYSPSRLVKALRLSWSVKINQGYFLRSESFFNIATYLDKLQELDGRTLASYGGKSLHKQSHGESFGSTGSPVVATK